MGCTHALDEYKEQSRSMKGLTTQTKLRIARILSATAILARKCLRKPSLDQFTRKGIRWELDLNEGIDLSIYLFGRFEYDVYHGYKNSISTGHVILDIGANIGAHSLPMAELAGSNGRVHAFEPTVFAVSKLKKNLSLNPELEQRVVVHHTLLNDGSALDASKESIPSSWNLNPDDEATHPQHGGSFMELGDVTVSSLDDIVKEAGISRVDLIKLDVDGNEWSVLQGSAETFDAYEPDVLMEFAPDYDLEDFEKILQFFKARNYQIFSMSSKKPLPDNLSELRKHIPKDGSINVKLSKNRT